MKTFSKILIFLAVVILAILRPVTISAESPSTILDVYIKQGIDNNLSLQQRVISYKQSLEALKSARSYFFPTVDLNARYTRANGGRTIEFAIGDALNPVYHSLNDIQAFLGQDGPFPENIPNEEINFLRQKEHETKVRLMQPIFQPEIFYNSKIKSNQAAAEIAAMEAFKRQLVEDIKTAYFQHTMTHEVVKIHESGLKLLQENKHVTQSLIEHDKLTREPLYRIEAEISGLEAQLASAVKDMRTSAAYFNFLLNRPLNSEIVLDTIAANSRNIVDKIVLQNVIDMREETQQLIQAIEVSENLLRLNRSTYLPTLVGVIDYGFQGEHYAFSKDDDFWMASLVMNWNLFNGLQKKAENRKSKLAIEALEAQQNELLANIELQLLEANLEVQEIQKKLEATKAKKEYAEKNFILTSKKYAQNLVSQIEWLDAQNMLTTADLELSISRFELEIAYAHLERVAALYEF